MATTTQVDRLIDRWDDSGLLQQGQARLLRDDLADHGLPAPEAGDGAAGDGAAGDGGPALLGAAAPGGRFEAAISAGLEAIGYLGAALVLGALAYLADVASWPEPAGNVLLALITGTTAYAVWRWTPATPGPQSRLVTVLGSAGLASLLGLLMLVLDPCTSRGCGWFAHRVELLLVAGPGAAAAAWLYLRERNAVTHAWLGVGAGTVVYGLSQAFLAPTADWRTEQVVAALFLLPAAIGWIWATETERITPSWIGTFGAAWLAGAMLMALVDLDLFSMDDAGPPLALVAYGLAFVAAGVVNERWRLTLIGALSLVWAVPWTMVDVLEMSETATALTLLPVGLALVAWVIRRLTADRRLGVPG